jgi:hypothetical protein
MTERQDLRPLSTEDLLPGRDRTGADDQYRADEYAADTGAVDTTDGQHHDGTGSVVHDQYDDVDVAAEHRDEDGTEQRYDDEQPTALDETGHDGTVHDQAATHDGTVQDETAVAAADGTARQKPTENVDSDVALFSAEEVDQFRTEWRGLQSDFVDSPRDAVQHADQLVAQVMQSLATTFADHKKSLEGQWSQGEQVETEELRVALRQYRSFFDKLLTVG